MLLSFPSDSFIHPDTLLIWCKKQVALYDSISIENMTTSFKVCYLLLSLPFDVLSDSNYNSLVFVVMGLYPVICE